MLATTIIVVTILLLAFVRVSSGSLTSHQAAIVLACLAATEFTLAILVSLPFSRGGISSDAALLLVTALISAALAVASEISYLVQPTPAVQRSRNNRQARKRRN